MATNILPGSSLYISPGDLFHIKVPSTTQPLGDFTFYNQTKNPIYNIEPLYIRTQEQNLIYTFDRYLKSEIASEGVIATPEAVAAANTRAKRIPCDIVGIINLGNYAKTLESVRKKYV